MNRERLLALTCVCHIFGVLLFMYGYFPNKSSNSYGFASVSDFPPEPGVTLSPNGIFYRRMVSKVVLIVIDALRADFVFDKSRAKAMPYLQSLLSNNQAFGLTALAQPPTVTLPRLKAITTGTIPGYIDVMLNFGASSLNEDNLLYQAKKNQLKIVFYGDDTWIRLFPNSFLRSEGTTSFFVTDFKQVDDNVTRHIPFELKSQDWDLLIVHYLGLDHIGHVVGPYSPLIDTKLTEMDDVIRLIHTSLQNQSSNSSLKPLVVICGDHGMNNAGSHGGSSSSEIEIPLIFTMQSFEEVVKRLKKKTVSQVDLTASLSILLGLPIPKSSVGKIVPEVLSALDWRRRLYLTYANAYQMYQVAQRQTLSEIDTSCLDFHKAKEAHRLWLSGNCSMKRSIRCDVDAEVVLKTYYNVMSELSASITSRSIGYDHFAMFIAVITQWSALIVTVISLVSKFTSNGIDDRFWWTFLTVLTTIVACGYFGVFGESLLQELRVESAFTILFSAYFLTLFVKWLSCCGRQLVACKSQRQQLLSWSAGYLQSEKSSFLTWWFGFALLSHSISLAASSFVEEEHYTWYFITTTTFLIGIHALGRSWVVEKVRCEQNAVKSNENYIGRIAVMLGTVLMFRVGRVWNSTGDKWVSVQDIGDWLNKENNEDWMFLNISCAILLMTTLRVWDQANFRKFLLITMGCLLWLYHVKARYLLPVMEYISSNNVARLAFVVNLVIPFSGLCTKKRSNRITCFLHGVDSFWLFTAALLSRPHNLGWLALVSLQDHLLLRYLRFKELSVENITLLRLFVAKSTFFQQGNSNNLARIDLVGGYVGLDTYHPVMIGVLLTCSTYSSFIFWLSSLALHIYKHEPIRFSKNLLRASLVLIVTQLLIWSFYTIFASVLRYHLFVWTVFSPKLLFEGTFSVIIVISIAYFNLLQFL